MNVLRYVATKKYPRIQVVKSAGKYSGKPIEKYLYPNLPKLLTLRKSSIRRRLEKGNVALISEFIQAGYYKSEQSSFKCQPHSFKVQHEDQLYFGKN